MAPNMWIIHREMQFLILQYLEDKGLKETAHKLEQESGIFFNMKYFEEKALAGEWDDVEKYLLGFTKMDDNSFSMKIFFQIRKQKYLEALDRGDKSRALEILLKELKVFSTYNEELFNEMTQLLTLDNFRENEQLSKYGDTKSARSTVLLELKKMIEANPLLQNKLIFPILNESKLLDLIKQSLKWQHSQCVNPRPNPDIKTLFTDHTCSPPNVATTLPLPSFADLPDPSSFAALGLHNFPFPPPPPAFANALPQPGRIMNANPFSSVQSSVVAASSLPGLPNQVSFLGHSRLPSDNS